MALPFLHLPASVTYILLLQFLISSFDIHLSVPFNVIMVACIFFGALQDMCCARLGEFNHVEFKKLEKPFKNLEWGGGGYSMKFYMGRLRPEDQTLAL